MSPAPARGFCQAGRHLPHHGKRCPKTHWDALSEAGSALKTKLKARFLQQGAEGSSKTCHCRRGHGGFPPRPETRREVYSCALGKAAAPDPSLSLCHRKGRGGSEGSGAGGFGRGGGAAAGGAGAGRGFHRGDPHIQSPPPLKRGSCGARPCPLASRLLPPERTSKVLRASAPPRIKGFACASARRLEHPPPQFLIPAIDGAAAEPAGQRGRAEPDRAPPRHRAGQKPGHPAPGRPSRPGTARNFPRKRKHGTINEHKRLLSAGKFP